MIIRARAGGRFSRSGLTRRAFIGDNLVSARARSEVRLTRNCFVVIAICIKL